MDVVLVIVLAVIASPSLASLISAIRLRRGQREIHRDVKTVQNQVDGNLSLAQARLASQSQEIAELRAILASLTSGATVTIEHHEPQPDPPGPDDGSRDPRRPQE